MSILLVFGAKTFAAFVKFHTMVWNVGSILSCLGNFFAASERRSGDNKESESNQGHLDGVCQTDLFNCCALTTLFSIIFFL
jgi:hypothetical protein